MKRRCARILSVFLVVAVIVGVVPLMVGCNFDRKVAKAAKKLNSYDIVATLDDENKKIEAVEKVKIRNTFGNDVFELWFSLYGRAFRDGATILPYSPSSKAKCFPDGESFGNLEILYVRQNGLDLEFRLDGEDENALVVLAELKKGKTIEIEIGFVLTLAKTTHRLGYFDGNINLGNWYPILCVYENGKWVCDPYYSNGDPFYSECANYKVSVVYPAKYDIGSTGEITKEVKENGNKKTTAEAKAVRDFAVVLGEDFVGKEARVGETTVVFLGYDNDTDIDQNLDTAKRALTTFNKMFGVYPYRTLTVAKTPFLYGGMEYPNLVWIADNISDDLEIVKVIVHEIAHQWWYGVVGNNEVKCAYIDESMAEYSTAMFFDKNKNYNYSCKQMVQEAATSYELYSEVISSINGTINDKLNLPSNEFATEYEYVYVVYVKGVMFLDALREKVGDKAFLKALESYYKKFAFKTATRDDFLSAFSKANGDDISDFFNEWKA